MRTLNGATVTTGEREIEPTEAAIVQRIFREFIAGHSPKQIAKMLNREGISVPSVGSGARARFTATRSVARAF